MSPSGLLAVGLPGLTRQRLLGLLSPPGLLQCYLLGLLSLFAQDVVGRLGIFAY